MEREERVKKKEQYISRCSFNGTIYDSVRKADRIINSKTYKKILVTISGGADSDIVLDILSNIDTDRKCEYLFIDTGIEYEATKRHLEILEKKYQIQLLRVRASTSVPAAIADKGEPFISKRVADYIGRLQRHGFRWEDEPLPVLLERYCKKPDPEQEKELMQYQKPDGTGYKRPWTCIDGQWYTGCTAALKWWCSAWGENSKFNISRNKLLKEFIVENPPQFRISSACCQSKREMIAKIICTMDADLNICGVRKDEGGQRSAAYSGDLTRREDGCDDYRVIYYWTLSDRQEYEECFGITHSDCYTVYGLTRTGCCGCPFGRDSGKEMNMTRVFEPMLHSCAERTFGKAHAYDRMYREYIADRGPDRPAWHQMSIFDPEMAYMFK